MKVKINSKELLNVIARIKVLVSERGAMPILSSILLIAEEDSIEIQATDLETAFYGKYPAKIISPGSVIIPHKELLNFLRGVKSDEIDITKGEKGEVNIFDGKTSFNFFCIETEEFPVILDITKYKKILEISSDVLGEAVSKSLIIKPPRDGIGGGMGWSSIVFFKIIEEENQSFLRIVSIDSNKLIKIDKKISNEYKEMKEGILISKSGLEKLNKIFLSNIKKQKERRGLKSFSLSSSQMISLGIEKNFITIQKQNEIMQIKLFKESFPSYSGLIREEESKNMITVNRKVLLENLKRISAMNTKREYFTKTLIRANKLEMIFTDPDLGEIKTEMGIKYNGGNIITGWNIEQFIDFLKSMNAEEVYLDILDNESPCILREKGDKEIVFLIMPCRLSKE